MSLFGFCPSFSCDSCAGHSKEMRVQSGPRCYPHVFSLRVAARGIQVTGAAAATAARVYERRQAGTCTWTLDVFLFVVSLGILLNFQYSSQELSKTIFSSWA